jgi:hypothetical protein
MYGLPGSTIYSSAVISRPSAALNFILLTRMELKELKNKNKKRMDTIDTTCLFLLLEPL